MSSPPRSIRAVIASPHARSCFEFCYAFRAFGARSFDTSLSYCTSACSAIRVRVLSVAGAG